MHPLRDRLNALPLLAKVGLVLGGYLGAVLLAFCAVWINAAQTDAVDSAASAGMQAFGDSLLFVAVFGLAAFPPTALALYFALSFRRRKEPACPPTNSPS